MTRLEYQKTHGMAKCCNGLYYYIDDIIKNNEVFVPLGAQMSVVHDPKTTTNVDLLFLREKLEALANILWGMLEGEK
jgi:hypothetical protein